jgi:ABC-2 type transport system ATP-binding protein
MKNAIQTENLGRIYKIRGGKNTEARELVALRDVSMSVQPGELFGLLGPNGAGKTTLIKILTTLLSPTSGRAWVAGYDVSQDAEKVRTRINMVSGGESSGYGLLTVRENLWMFSQFYGLESAEANRRIKNLLEVVGMGDRLNSKSSDLSTGLRQKMNIVRGFLTDPDVLFLDEPTLGLDVSAARDVRNFIRHWVDEDRTRTLLLTTHYMVEADELCDRVAIINQGRVLACDSPANLKHRLQADLIYRLDVSSLDGPGDGRGDSPGDGPGVQDYERIPGVKKVLRHERESGLQLEFVLEEEPVLGSVINELTSRGVRLLNLQKREPTLEDVFVDLVGRSMAEVEHKEKQEKEK